MKTLMIIAISIASIGAFAGDRTLNLDTKDVTYGALVQSARTAALDKVEVVRTKSTPKKVDVHYSVKESQSVCAEYRTHRVWHPGHTERFCRTVSDSHGRTRTICRNVHRPGYYTTERRCVRWDSIMVTRNKEIRLNFKKAKKLSGEQREVFLIEFRQENVNSSKIKLSGEVVEATRGYNIRFEKFLKDSLKFEVK